MDIVKTLRSEHDRVLDMFKKFQTVDEAGKVQLVKQLVRELSVHETAEEAAVWPELRTRIKATLIEEAIREENEAKPILKRLAGSLEGAELQRLVTKLEEAVRHHISTEQDQIFPLVTKEVDENLRNKLGTAYMEAKQALMDRMAKLNVTMAPEIPIEQLRRS